MSPPVIKAVRKKAGAGMPVIVDAPPGTSCPVIEAVRGSDFCLLVTEPTPFGLNDLKLAVATVRLLGIPLGVVMNRVGVGDSATEAFCAEEDIELMMSIPYDKNIARAYSQGIPLVGAFSEYKESFVRLYERIEERVNERIGHP